MHWEKNATWGHFEKMKMKKIKMMMKNNDEEKGMKLKPTKNGGGMTRQEVIKRFIFSSTNSDRRRSKKEIKKNRGNTRKSTPLRLFSFSSTADIIRVSTHTNAPHTQNPFPPPLSLSSEVYHLLFSFILMSLSLSLLHT